MTQYLLYLEQIINKIAKLYYEKNKYQCIQSIQFDTRQKLLNGIIDLKYLDFFSDNIIEDHILSDYIFVDENENDLILFHSILQDILEFYFINKIKIKSISLSNNSIGYKSMIILINLFTEFINRDRNFFIELKKISLCGNFLNNECMKLLCKFLALFPDNYQCLEELKLGYFEFGQLGENIDDNGFKYFIELIMNKPQFFFKLNKLYLDSLNITFLSLELLNNVFSTFDYIIFPNLKILRISGIIENSLKLKQNICTSSLYDIFYYMRIFFPSLQSKNIHYLPYFNSFYILKNQLRLNYLNHIKFEKVKFNKNSMEKFCPISHEDFNDNEILYKIRNCNHIFSKNSILQWSKFHNTCPLCRTSFV